MSKFISAACALAFAVLMLGSAPASAHAVLVSTDPSNGARLDVAPNRVSLTFNENIGSRAFVVVTTPEGKRLKTKSVTAVDNKVTATIPKSDIKGDYLMAYRVVSADGHAISATVKFTVTTGRTVTQVQQPEDDSFVHRHKSHLIWGAVGVLVALGLMLVPLRKHRDSEEQ